MEFFGRWSGKGFPSYNMPAVGAASLPRSQKKEFFMAYKFQPGKMYRMPTHFGPLMGPRQGPDGRKFECVDNPKNTSISVSFLSNAEQLKALLPECF